MTATPQPAAGFGWRRSSQGSWPAPAGWRCAARWRWILSCFEIVFITGEAADDLVTKARAAGHEVVLMPHLRSEIAPRRRPPRPR